MYSLDGCKGMSLYCYCYLHFNLPKSNRGLTDCSNMRLYDQKYNTLVNADSRKWNRPNNFLPSQDNAELQSPPFSRDKHVASPKTNRNEVCGSEASAPTSVEVSRVYNSLTLHDSFRFDIDEEQEFSMKSSSTLSTKSTFQQYRADTLKPISVANYGSTDHDSPESSRSSSRDLNGNIVATSSHESSATEFRNNITTSYLPSNSREAESSSSGDEDFFTPQLTLTYTQSSEEDNTVWFDFPGFGGKNPFRDRGEFSKSKLPKNFPSTTVQETRDVSSTMNRWSRDDQNTPRSYRAEPSKRNSTARKLMVPRNPPIAMRQGTDSYTRYHKMLLSGSSVFDVSKAMKEDSVDPSIVSLVLAASVSHHYSWRERSIQTLPYDLVVESITK